MPIPKEICVFFPCHTLEDFPTHLRNSAASGLLAAWTAPWHPRILATVGTLPSWYRADTPPLEIDGRLLLVATAAESRLPSDLNQRVGDAREASVISVAGQEETTEQILGYLSRDTAQAEPPAVAQETDDGPTAADFHALGYAALQVQLMTRQLRYSSNLDQVVFGEHALAAAQAWCAGRGSEAQERLQAAFDLLGEERDHYFSSDPHLIDLVLVADTTTGPELLETLHGDTPLNLLMSAAVAEKIAAEAPRTLARIQERHAAGTLGVAGGGSDDAARLEWVGSDAAARWLRDSVRRTEIALGFRPIVFGRLGGGIPGDLPPLLLAAGYRGAITSDFTAGTGSQNEAKMLWQSGGAEIESLTARPLDVLQPQTFLAIGPRLGEAADSGQVAAALVVRWPGSDRPLLDCLRRAARYGLALGRFWTVDDLFTKGERPYHSCTLPSVVGDGAALTQAVERDQPNPLTSVASLFRQELTERAIDACAALATLSAPNPMGASAGAGSPRFENLESAATQLCRAMGFETLATAASAPSIIAVINPHCGPARARVVLGGPPPIASTPGLFGSMTSQRTSTLTVDIPGLGFATFASNPSGKSVGGLMSLIKRPKPLASGIALTNEFLDIAIHPDSGGVAAVHAGAQRGNRFSWQLAFYNSEGPEDGYSTMHCKRLRVRHADTARGTIGAEGDLRIADKTIGTYEIEYTVHRGSRWLEIQVQVDVSEPFRAAPWRSYVAGRAAWSSDALSIRPLARDKRHRTSGRRIESPLGVVIDEGDRQLQVSGYGLPAHRRVSSKRLDTLLQVAGEQEKQFQLAYGFDVSAPVRAAHQQVVPPVAVPLSRLPDSSNRGWLMDLDSRAAVITEWSAPDNRTLVIRVVETSGKPSRVRIRAFRNIESATRLVDGGELPIEKDAAVLRLSGHELTEVRLTFAAPA